MLELQYCLWSSMKGVLVAPNLVRNQPHCHNSYACKVLDMKLQQGLGKCLFVDSLVNFNDKIIGLVGSYAHCTLHRFAMRENYLQFLFSNLIGIVGKLECVGECCCLLNVTFVRRNSSAMRH